MLKLLFVVLWFSLAFSGALWLSLAVSLALRLSPVLFWFLWLSICILWTSPACSAVSGVLWTSLAAELGWAKNLKMDGCQIPTQNVSFPVLRISLLGQSLGGVLSEPGSSSSSLEAPVEIWTPKISKCIEKPKENDEFGVSWLGPGSWKCWKTQGKA